MLTILFATYNGMQTLPRMLERLRKIQRPEGLRIVAVDNRSDDGSYELLVRSAKDLPITVFHCTEPGKNRSLNYALDQIAASFSDQGLVVITDDDILPDEDWLLQLTRSAIAHPEANVFGGTIKPVWPDQVPNWLPKLEDEYPVLFATTTALHGPCSSRQIYGPNMAVRGKLFKNGLRFNPDIGPDGSQNFGMGSESELLRRLERDGHRMFFCQHAVVGHLIKPSLLRWSSVLSRARRYGLGLGRLDQQEHNRFVVALTAIKRAALSELKSQAVKLPIFANRRTHITFWRGVERGRLASLVVPSLPTFPKFAGVTKSNGRSHTPLDGESGSISTSQIQAKLAKLANL